MVSCYSVTRTPSMASGGFQDTTMVLQAAQGTARWTSLPPCCPLLSRSLVGIMMAPSAGPAFMLLSVAGPPAFLHPARCWPSLSQSVSPRRQALQPFLPRTWGSGICRPWCWVGFPRRQTLRSRRLFGGCAGRHLCGCTGARVSGPWELPRLG